MSNAPKFGVGKACNLLGVARPNNIEFIGARHSIRVWMELLKLDEFTCQICGEACSKDVATIDHIIPVAHGGHRTDWDNMRLACFACNNARGSSMDSKDWHSALGGGRRRV